MTTVIDRLRVQGGVAPACPPGLIRAHQGRLSIRKDTVKNSAASNVKGTGRIHIGSTPMVKSGDFLSILGEKGMGEESSEYPGVYYQNAVSSPKVSFVLSGKGVKESTGFTRSNSIGRCTRPKTTRAGSYKTNPKELYRVSHGISLKYGTEPSPFGHGIHACFDPDIEDQFSRISLKTAKSTRSQVDTLGNPSALSVASHFAPPSTAPTSHNRAMTSLELTGQRFQGDTLDDFSNYRYYDPHILDDSYFPYLRSPRRSMRMSRPNTQQCQGDEFTRLQNLQDCLKIHKTVVPGVGKNSAQQAGLGAKEGYSNDGRHKLGEVKKDLRRYEFTNVGSYLRYNRHQSEEQAVAASKPRLAHIPRGVITLPEPWAESVLFKLMKDLRPPRSRLSSDRYSDNQEDSDEFFVIGSPTSLDKHNNLVMTQRSSGGFRKRHRSVKNSKSNCAEDKINEEDINNDQDEGFHTDGNQTTRSDSSVDHNDLEKHEDLDRQNDLKQNNGTKPELTVSATKFKPLPKDTATKTPAIVTHTASHNSEEKDPVQQGEYKKIVVPVENSFGGENDSLANEKIKVQKNDENQSTEKL